MPAELNPEVVPAAVVPAITPTVPTVTPLTDESLVEIQENGQSVKKPWKDVKSGILMQQDYTRKTQEVAAERAANAKTTAELQDIYKAVLAKQAEVDSYKERLSVGLGLVPAEVVDPNAPLTKADVEKMFKAHAAQITDATARTVTERERVVEERRQFEHYEGLTKSTVDAMVSQYPNLKSIPHLDLVLKREAGLKLPKTEGEMVQLMIAAAKDISDKTDAAYTERTKAAVLKKQNLTTKGSEQLGPIPTYAAPTQKFTKGRRGLDIEGMAKHLDSLADAE